MIKKLFYRIVRKQYLKNKFLYNPFICCKSSLFKSVWEISYFQELIRQDAKKFVEIKTKINPMSDIRLGYRNLLFYSGNICEDQKSFKSIENERIEFLDYMATGKILTDNESKINKED